MKLIFAVLGVSFTMGFKRYYKTKVFLHLYLQFYTYFALFLLDTLV